MNAKTITALLSALALAGVAQPASAQEIILKVHHFLPPNTNTNMNLIVPWCDKIAKDSNNRLKCQIYPSLQLGGTPPQMFDQARDGVADVVYSVPTYQAARFTKTEVFELPFMITNGEGASRAIWDYVQKNALDEFKGVKPIAIYLHSGTVIFTNKPVRNLEELKGTKLRVANRLMVKYATALGAVPVQMPVPSVPEALAKNVIDGEMSGWEAANVFKLQEITKFYIETAAGMPKIGDSLIGIFMNQAKYDSLPADLKKVIDQNSGRETSAWAGKVHMGDVPVGRKISEERNNTSIVISAEEYERWRKATAKVTEEWIAEVTAKGLNGKALHDDAVALLKKYGG